MTRLSIIILLTCIPDIIAFTAIQKQQQSSLLSSQLHVSKTTIPDLASETKPIDESNIFSNSDDTNEDNDDASWQKNLDILLAPNTSTTERQIVLSDLLSSGDEIQESVRTALRERKVSVFLY